MKPEMALEKPKLDGYQVLDRIRSHWLSMLAHDLSSPLFAVRGYTRLALEEKDSPLTESRRRYLTAVLENVDRLVTFAQELNDVPPKDAFEFDTLSFRTLLQHAADGVRSGLAGRNIQLTEHYTDGPLTTIGDREKLTAAVRGFLLLAVDITGSGGTIRMQAHEEDEKIILRFSATRSPGGSPGSQPDISIPCKLWRLHGGVVSVSLAPDSEYLVVCELPMIRLSEC